MRRPVMYLAGLLLATGASFAFAGPASAAVSHGTVVASGSDIFDDLFDIDEDNDFSYSEDNDISYSEDNDTIGNGNTQQGFFLLSGIVGQG
jgi:hypothetical protein